jgi:N-sulfoglucosamine sulfohydrolase
LGCYGNPTIRTPNIDAFASRATLFTHAFATVASCSPSRAVVLTGLFTHTNGQYGLAHDVHHAQTFRSVHSVPKRLKEAGYRTGMIGKLHVLPADVYPFDVHVGGREVGGGKDVDGMADAVGRFIAEDRQKPFFLWVGFTDPHRAGKGFGNEGKLDVPSERYDLADVTVPPFLPDLPEVKRDIADYYQAVTRLDRGVGLVLDALDKAGLTDTTLVVFLSDNGMPFPGAKTTLYDAGVHLPLIVSSPQQTARGKPCDAMASWVDLAPTILDWAGVNANRMPGRSLLPLLNGEQQPDRDVVFGSHVQHEVTMYYPMRSIRTRTHKYILNLAHGLEFPTAGDLYRSPTWQTALTRRDNKLGGRDLAAYVRRPREELYDLEKDPDELKNVASEPAYATVLPDFRARLKHWQGTTGDPWLVKYEHE